MRAKKKLKPGQAGTKKLVEVYGDRLVCVRYRYDEVQAMRYKTIELIVESVPWEPVKIAADKIVGVVVALGEVQLQNTVRRAGGKWNRTMGWIELRYDTALRLNLKSRIVPSTLLGDTQNTRVDNRKRKIATIS